MGSHRYRITFQDMQGDMQGGREKKKPESYAKLKNTCLRAEEDGITYVWIDNFCIDKESSAELSESINSMYLWYKEAKTCYAFMADVQADHHARTSIEFAHSRWFKRGWTLQELIAPKNVTFYSKDWTVLGTRITLATEISGITKIDEGILKGIQGVEYMSVAKRMSWASNRETTRQEDMAYCLMGLFGVNMAMLYGEGGEKAFRRLQEQIMQDSDDETLFAWTNSDAERPELQGLLAKSPKDFRNSSSYIANYDRSTRIPPSTTSKGLCVTFGLVHFEKDIWVGSLDCPIPPAYDQTLAIYLKLLDKQSQQYARTNVRVLCKIPQGAQPQTIYVRQKPLIPGFDDVYLHHAFQLRNEQVFEEGSDIAHGLEERGYHFIDVVTHPLSGFVPPLPTSAPKEMPLKTLELVRGSHQLAGAIIFQRPDRRYVAVMLGSKPSFGIGVRVHAGIHYYMVDIIIQETPPLLVSQTILNVTPELSNMGNRSVKKWKRIFS
ncbi:HET domain-containing protein [Rutstroemia sp. NJR-2017a WRK4]|nr:HET domain-containing protein [Rutstroemia sp. NJR-2017a WRK4]